MSKVVVRSSVNPGPVSKRQLCGKKRYGYGKGFRRNLLSFITHLDLGIDTFRVLYQTD